MNTEIEALRTRRRLASALIAEWESAPHSANREEILEALEIVILKTEKQIRELTKVYTPAIKEPK